MTLDEAYGHCAYLARHHYENFPVGRFVPASIRPHVFAVYAFARTADDIADEGYQDPRLSNREADGSPTQAERLEALQAFRADLQATLNGTSCQPEHEWIFLPLADTIKKCRVPQTLFFDLLSAFEQDIVQSRYTSFDEVLDYCSRSANPIGRLVLHLHDYREEKLHQMSDCICTALQLANFWQDVSVDLGKNRIYLPQDDLERNGVDEAELFAGEAGPGFTRVMQDLVERTWTQFRMGRNLPRYLRFPLSWEIRLTWLGGTTILRKIEKQNFNTLGRRPTLKKRELPFLACHAFLTR